MSRHVEFLRDESDEPALPPSPPERRHLRLYRIGAIAVALLSLVLWASTRPDGGGRPTARPVPTPLPSSSEATAPPSSEATAPPSAKVTASPSPLPSVIACRLGAPVADEIVAAMQRYLPSVKIDNLRAYRCARGRGESGRIVFEAITGHVGTLNIDVEATLRTGDHAGTNASPRLGARGRRVLISRAEAVAAGLQVDVNAYGRAGQRPPVFAMRGLADFISLNVIL